MATTTRVKRPDLYDEDFPAWVEQQVRALRTLAASGVVPAELDLPNLIEEVEDLRKTEQRTVESHVVNIIVHLLKLEHSPAGDPRRVWAGTVDLQRNELADVLTRNLERHLEKRWQAKYPIARGLAATGLARDGVRLDDLPERCPYTLDQIRDPDWWPRNRHGLDPSEGGHP